MFIELTDHLRCPRDHPEAFLVLLPDRIEQRQVLAGHLGCPVCGWSTDWTDGVPDFGDAWSSHGTIGFDADAAHVMLGLNGPGGWIALAGNAGSLVAGLLELLPGVSIVAVNPPAEVTTGSGVSIIRGGAWPIKAHAMRGAILGTDAGAWRASAIASTLPGLRTIGCGDPPAAPESTLLGQADGVWVVTGR